MNTTGQRLGSYQLVRLLAHGGMADVFLALRDDGREVAVKVLNTDRVGDDQACALFHDEARVASVLAHPHVARVLEANEQAGVHYLAMEYVRGKDVREVLGACGHATREVPFDVAIAIVCAAAAGLDHAHRRCDRDGRPLHLVHRDVSLSNIMVGFDGGVKVVDFGIASASGALHSSLPGIVRGKASYMAPEQCLGGAVDGRADVFGLGVVLYEMTTGKRCFLGDADIDRMFAAVRGDFIKPTAHDPAFPPALEAVILRALAVNPSERFDSAAAMLDALVHVAIRHGWATGAAPIATFMRELFVEARPRLARGTEQQLPAPAVPLELPTRRHVMEDLEDDMPTRGRRSAARLRAVMSLAA